MTLHDAVADIRGQLPTLVQQRPIGQAAGRLRRRHGDQPGPAGPARRAPAWPTIGACCTRWTRPRSPSISGSSRGARASSPPVPRSSRCCSTTSSIDEAIVSTASLRDGAIIAEWRFGDDWPERLSELFAQPAADRRRPPASRAAVRARRTRRSGVGAGRRAASGSGPRRAARTGASSLPSASCRACGRPARPCSDRVAPTISTYSRRRVGSDERAQNIVQTRVIS